MNKGNNGRVSSNLPPEGAPLRFGARTTLSMWLLALQARELGEPLTVLARDLQEVSARVQTPERRIHLQRPHPQVAGLEARYLRRPWSYLPRHGVHLTEPLAHQPAHLGVVSP